MTLPLVDWPDGDLLERCRDGHADAWAVLVRRYQRLIYTVPRRAGLGEAEAADVFQTCFTRLFEALPRLSDPSRVRAWLVTTAKRETLRLLGLQARHRAPAAPPGGEDEDEDDPLARLPDPDPLPEQLLSRLQEEDRLRRALARLPEPTRHFIELLFLQDPPLAYAELARRLDLPIGSIGPSRARALDKLRRAMAELDGADDVSSAARTALSAKSPSQRAT